MKKLLPSILVATTLVCMTSCASGPRRLTRTWDDWVNQKYTQNAWLHGAVLQDVIPVYTLVGLVMTLGDVIVVNPWYFWTKDAWDNRGTGFDHVNPTDTTRSVSGYTDG